MSTSFREEKQISSVNVNARTRTPSDSSVSTISSLKVPRVTRFAEATSVVSPIDGNKSASSRPHIMSNPFTPEEQPGQNAGSKCQTTSDPGKPASYPTVPSEEGDSGASYLRMPSASATPFKSSLKTPGTARRLLSPLSPTFQEELILEKQEASTDKQQARDLTVKTRVRMAKLVLRGVNFTCSLIVVCMLSTTLTIFNSTKNLPSRNGLLPWSKGTNPWPQIVLLSMSSFSLLCATIILATFCLRGHRRAEKYQTYFTTFSVAFAIFSIVMFSIGAGILQGTRATSNDTDIWGWSCKDGTRKTLFDDDVHYALVCRLQQWSLVCALVEIAIELITVILYAVIFYRFWTKHKLHKSMDVRDKARSDLYMAQLRSQSQPNTPGQGLGQGYWGYMMNEDKNAGINGTAQYPSQFAQEAVLGSGMQRKSFQLQPPPIKVQNASPRPESRPTFSSSPLASPVSSRQCQNGHSVTIPAELGERTYETVPIPGAYGSPLASPAFPSTTSAQTGHNGNERNS